MKFTRTRTITEQVTVSPEYIAADSGFYINPADHDLDCPTPTWELFAANQRHLTVDNVPEFETALMASGGATLVVKGSVGDDAIILVVGGGATVTVLGNVGARARILCAGGGATVVVHGSVSPEASIIARGGASTVVLLGKSDGEAHARGGNAQVLRRA